MCCHQQELLHFALADQFSVPFSLFTVSIFWSFTAYSSINPFVYHVGSEPRHMPAGSFPLSISYQSFRKLDTSFSGLKFKSEQFNGTIVVLFFDMKLLCLRCTGALAFYKENLVSVFRSSTTFLDVSRYFNAVYYLTKLIQCGFKCLTIFLDVSRVCSTVFTSTMFPVHSGSFPSIKY